jgi:AraC-like DNA-binding protein
VHAAVVIARGWSGDLLEGRRRLRALVLGFAALFAMAEVLLAFAVRLSPHGPWRYFVVGGPIGGATMTAVAVAVAALFLEAQLAMFGVARRAAAGPDGRAEAVERVMLEKLNALMAAGGWRREGLTIGQLAGELGEPEHRLRRLINQRLGHRNFAEFVNSYRIEAAKARLSDPAEARTTVAAIAFELGYGSLGPFNRAFRAATGATPTEWRREALQTSPELQEAV